MSDSESGGRRLWLLLSALGVAGLLMFWQVSRSSASLTLPLFDYVEYWAAGSLLAEGNNPYSAELMDARERSVGREEEVVMMWNPPWTLPFVLPFGLLPVHTGHLIWILLSLGMMLLSADLLWRCFHGSSDYRWGAWLVVLTFAPTLIALTAGQISPWLLMGAALFLFLLRCEMPLLAGAATTLMAIKPHLSYLLWICLLLWAIDQKQWRVILGGILTGALLFAVPLLLYPDVLRAWLDALATRPPAKYDSPTMGTIIRKLFAPDEFRLQYLSMVPGLIWVIWYWRKHRGQWQWSERLPTLLFVSMLTAAYGAWPFDTVLLLVGVIQIAALVSVGQTAWNWKVAVAAHLLISIATGALIVLDMGYFSFLWLTPTLLLLYCFFHRGIRRVTHA